MDLNCECAVVVGNGNVAMDVARILAISPDELAKSDITAYALEKLRQSTIREVVLLGRRGSAQASFSNPEIKELGKLRDVDMIVDPQTGNVQPGEYVVGWAKRGPTGLIGNNKPDSAATVESMLADLPMLQGISADDRDPSRIDTLLSERGVDFVTYQDWRILDQYEVACGSDRGCPRVKLTTVPEMMAVIRKGR